MSALPSRSFGLAATLTVAVIGGLAFFFGFYVLPAGDPTASVWQRICRAAGVVRLERASPYQHAPADHTSVIVPTAAFDVGSAEQIGRGATLALGCTGCHGAQGVSGAEAPNLAGQHAEVIYKELVDFQRRARTDAVMGAMASPLSEEAILALAHYYAYLPSPREEGALAAAPALIRVGDPMRSIAPCASCHTSHDGKQGAPSLAGEPAGYLRKQLAAFAAGSRRNDANAVMREETRRLTAAEINVVSNYYANTR